MATIRKRCGKYQAQVRKDGKYVSKTFISKAAAAKWAKEQEVAIEQGSYKSKKETVTLAFLLSRWEKEILSKLKSWPVEKYKVQMLSRSLGHYKLDMITSSILVEYRDTRLKVASNQTVKHELGVIRRAMKKGIEWGYIESVPFLASPSLKGQARTRRLTASEIAKLLASLDEYMRNVIILLIETAMRRGELAKIKKTDIDLDARLITLHNTKNRETRIVPVSNKAFTALQFLLQHATTEKLLNFRKEWVTEKFISHCKLIGIENFRLHDLRHEGVSKLFEKGLNMIEVSTISGHKDLSMLKRYTHIHPSTLVERI